MPDRLVPSATCLGCGCSCDDITLVIRDGRIVEAQQACALGVAWFGDGVVPATARVSGRPSSIDEALDSTAALVARAARPLVYLAPDLSCEAQRETVAFADGTRAMLDTITAGTASATILAAQTLGRAAATLGEVRNRADVVVFWGVDPAQRYPRFSSRYAPVPAGLHVADGRHSRHVVAVDIGDRRGPEDADLRVALDPDHEIGALSALIAIASTLPTAPTLDEIAGATAVGLDAHRTRGGASWDAARQLLPLLTHGCYVAIVADGESDLPREAGAARAEALARAAQTLNGPSRCALVTLRGGGNRVGADAVLTAQTGYPMTIDFARGYPRYVPFEDARARLRAGQIDAVLVAGDVARAADDTIRLISERPHAIIGPRATAGPLRDGAAAIDTAVAGIHEGGTALRLDDVPLPLRASVDGPPAAADVLRRLVQRMAAAPWQP